jgi:CheY-like chemotaxis protein
MASEGDGTVGARRGGGADRLDGVAVLVVDDDPALRYAVVRLLARAGASVRDGDAFQAVTQAIETPVDLLLTDVEMPGRNGAAVARAVAAICPRVTIVFMSGRSRDVHRAKGVLSDGDLLLEKPFTPGALVATLVTALAATRDRRGS